MAVSEPVAQIARRSAARLAEEGDPRLPALVERELATGGQGDQHGFSDTFDLGLGLALAPILVSIAQLAWTIYRDLKADREAKKAEATEAPDREQIRRVVIRRVQLKLPEETGAPLDARQQRMVEVVVEEILEIEGGQR